MGKGPSTVGCFSCNWGITSCRCICLLLGHLLEEQIGVPVCRRSGKETQDTALLVILCCWDGRWIFQVCCSIKGSKGCHEDVLHKSCGESVTMAGTNGLEANGSKGANQENLDLLSVSHCVCVLFLHFSWGQLRCKQMDFKVVGLNKSLHDILMIQVFGDCKTRLEISEDIYFCFFWGPGRGTRNRSEFQFFG